MKILLTSILTTLFLCLATSTQADLEPRWMREGARPMCAELPQECAPYRKGQKAIVELSTELHHQLDRVNREVNKQIIYQMDIDHYRKAERWTYPVDGRGDCEDYVLEKRRRLIALGWPRRALLITIVATRTMRTELHAVLMVRTSAGDLILDNYNREVVSTLVMQHILLWVQSQKDPNDYDKLRDIP